MIADDLSDDMKNVRTRVNFNGIIIFLRNMKRKRTQKLAKTTTNDYVTISRN